MTLFNLLTLQETENFELKIIKKAFRARDVQQETGWLKICSVAQGYARR